MSEIFGRLRVTENHGIRRFLYPLTAQIVLSTQTGTGHAVNPGHLCLVTDEGQPIPVQVTHIAGTQFRIDFGVSLAPHAVRDYFLKPGVPKVVDDPLQIREESRGGALRSHQQRFEITLLGTGGIGTVTYDGIRFLRAGLSISRGNWGVDEVETRTIDSSPASATLNAWRTVSGRYRHDGAFRTRVDITACKSWATVVHTLDQTRPNDEIVFSLPLAVASPTLTYDLGIEGVYGKIGAQSSDAVSWCIGFPGKSRVHWAVATNDRTDYAGSMTNVLFQSRRWFHLIDNNKSLAVAITDVPASCKGTEVTLRHDGEVRVAFRMRRTTEADARFGICYHFLNDVPAIAAATNPQSILLPPTVEVMAT